MIVENRLSLRGVNDFGKSRSRFCALKVYPDDNFI